MTFVLATLLIYLFMALSFCAFPERMVDRSGYYPDEVNANACQSMANCFMLFLTEGLIAGGGIGLFVSQQLGNPPPLHSRQTLGLYAFDLAFFVVVVVGMLNLLLGIIVDTFSTIRARAKEVRTLMGDRCTVCGLARRDFERREAGSWRHHYKREHNLWAYYAFLVHLGTKSPDEFTGLEDFVARCVAARSLAWLPRHQALAFSDSEAPAGGSATGARTDITGDGAGNGAGVS
jgi:hypothetical protein